MPSYKNHDHPEYIHLPNQDSLSEDSVILGSIHFSIPDSQDDQRSTNSDDQSDNQQKQENIIILPLFVYDCPLAVLINNYIHTEKGNSEMSKKDVYEDHTYKLTSHFDDDFLQRKKAAMAHRSPEHKCEESEIDDLNSSVRQHCKTLTLVHSKCFVVSLFKSLRFKIPIMNTDVQSAVDQCEEIVDEIDITEYLQVGGICLRKHQRHFKIVDF